MQDYIVYGLNLSRDGAYLLAAGSIVLAIATVFITIVALLVTALAIRASARENRLTKQMERELAREQAANRWLIMAAGMGEARDTRADGSSVPRLNVQLIAAAMLRNYPDAQPGVEVLRDQFRASNNPVTDEIADALAQSIKRMSG